MAFSKALQKKSKSQSTLTFLKVERKKEDSYIVLLKQRLLLSVASDPKLLRV